MAGRERWALALLAVSGAAFLPDALNRFVFPKLFVLAIAVGLAATVPARGRLPRGAVAIISAGALVLLGAALLGQTPVAQLVGRAPRYEGVFALAIYAGAGVAGARLLGYGRARGSTSWFLRWLAVAAIAIGVEAILESAGLRPLASNVSRPGSLLGNASDEGAWAVLALGPLAAVSLRVRGWLFLAGAIAAAATIVCSGSRGALVGAIVVAATLAVLAPRPALRVAVAGGLAALLLAAFALPATRVRVVDSSEAAVQTVTGRLLLWGETLRLLDAHPVLGVGPSGYLDAIPAYHTARYERKVGPANPPDSPHDWLLQAAADGGISLLLLAVALAGLTVWYGWRSVPGQPTGGESAAIAGMLAGLLGYGAALLFHFTSPGTAPLAAVFGGALLGGLPAPSRRPSDWIDRIWRRSHTPLRWVAIACMGALAVVMAATAAAEVPLRSAIDDAASDHLAAADHEFRIAHALRPWDAAVYTTAAHAFATLARDGIGTAIAPGLHWSAKELSAYPDSIQALSDAAVLDLADRLPQAATRRLERALRLEPPNPDLKQLRALDQRLESTGRL